MAFDEALADRIREQLAEAGTGPVDEKRMFGGLAFLLGGHMAVAAGGQGGLLVRADPAEADDLIARTTAERMVMNGRPMKAWLRVAAEGLTEDAALAEWVAVGTRVAGSLPPKA